MLLALSWLCLFLTPNARATRDCWLCMHIVMAVWSFAWRSTWHTVADARKSCIYNQCQQNMSNKANVTPSWRDPTRPSWTSCGQLVVIWCISPDCSLWAVTLSRHSPIELASRLGLRVHQHMRFRARYRRTERNKSSCVGSWGLSHRPTRSIHVSNQGWTF